MNRIAKMDEEKRLEMAEDYKNFFNTYDFSTYAKSRVICDFFRMDDRTWRKHVENIMHLYMYNYLDVMFIGTPKGYLLTGDIDLINKFLKAKEHQFKSLAYNCYNLKKAVDHKDNYTIDDYIADSLCK